MSKRKKYNPNKHLHLTPIHPSEHAENVGLLIDLADLLDNNNQTMKHFRELVLLHRLTFYSRHHEEGKAAIYERNIIELIFNKEIIPKSKWNDDEKCYKSNHTAKLNIHWQHRARLAKFARSYAANVLTVVSRKQYAYIIYNGITDHRAYLKLIDSPIWHFIDHKDDQYWVNQFRGLAKLHNVKE